MIDFSITFYINMRQIFLDTIKDHKLIEKNDTIIVGFSGGMDSSCLLDLLVSIKESYKLRLIGAHLNHLVRPEAETDEDFCRKRCQDLSIEFFSKSASMEDYAKEKKISAEEAGRLLRKEFFSSLMEKTGANKIALAHNFNDQVETLLMRIFRGTGLDGLRGMEYKEGNIIRPILNIKRPAIEAYIKAKDIPYVEDKTNFENIYHRNKIRNMIIPYIETSLGNSIEDQVFNLSSLAKVETAYLEKITNQNFERLCSETISGNIQVDVEGYLNLDKGPRYRLLRKIFQEKIGFVADISYKNILIIDQLFSKESGKYIDNIGNLRIRKSYDHLIFEKTEENTDLALYIELKEGINFINDKLQIKIEYSNKSTRGKDFFTLPVEAIKGPLLIRTRRNGDKIKALGLNGTKKLKDVFIDKKIDRADRDSYLVLADQEKIFAVIDLVKSQYIKEISKSNKYILVSLLKEEENHA